MGQIDLGIYKADTIPMVRPDGNLRTLAEIEAAAIDYALLMCGNRRNAAAALGIGRSTLYRKMQELGKFEPSRRGRRPRLRSLHDGAALAG
jgi:DNA-binding NtrC family response regulator